MDELKNYASPAKKIERMVKSGKLTRVVRGLYETDLHTPGHLLAASIYGPSYLSFEYALAHHGLIPEAVHQYTSASFDKKRAKQYETPFGVFSYRDIPEEAFLLRRPAADRKRIQHRLATPVDRRSVMSRISSHLAQIVRSWNSCCLKTFELTDRHFWDSTLRKWSSLPRCTRRRIISCFDPGSERRSDMQQILEQDDTIL